MSGLIVAGMVLAMSGQAHPFSLATIPAHWTGNCDCYEPRVGDFTFDALSFFTPSDGWILGNRFLLHARGDDLELSFVRSPYLSLTAADVGAADGWACGGYQDPTRHQQVGQIWRYRSGRWTSFDLTALDLGSWDALAIRMLPSGSGWVVGFRGTGPFVTPLLLSYDGDAWRRDSTPTDDGRDWHFSSLCLFPDGAGWFLGYDGRDGGRHALAVQRTRDGWQRVDVPDFGRPRSGAAWPTCFADGEAVALASSSSVDRADGTVFLIRFANRHWVPIPLPAAFSSFGVNAMAAVAADDVWLAVSCNGSSDACRPRFLHWNDGTWSEVRGPVLQEGRTSGYVVTGMQFVSPTEGWAVARDYEGPGLFRGLIFHYRDGVWRNRTWNWHFWNQPWFGLLGD